MQCSPSPTFSRAGRCFRHYSHTHSSNVNSARTRLHSRQSWAVVLSSSLPTPTTCASRLTASIHLVLHRHWRRFPPRFPIQQCSWEVSLVHPGQSCPYHRSHALFKDTGCCSVIALVLDIGSRENTAGGVPMQCAFGYYFVTAWRPAPPTFLR
jgi:hypothetical protein